MHPILFFLKHPLGHMAAFSLVVNLLLLAPALFMLQVFDRVLVGRSMETLGVLLVGTAIAPMLTLALDYLRGRLQWVAGNTLSEWLSPIATKSILARSARQGQRDIGEELRDVAAMRNLFSAQGLLAVFDAPWIVVYVAVIWLAHPLLGAAAAVAAMLMLSLAVINDVITRKFIEKSRGEVAKANYYLNASMNNAEVVQTLGMADALLSRWRKANTEAAAMQAPVARRSTAMAAITRAARQSVQVVIQALGAWLVISQESSPGVLVATTVLLGRALGPVEQIVGSWRVLAEGRLAFRRLRGLIELAGKEAPRMALPEPKGALEAQGLTFRAPGKDRLLLVGVSLALKPGESLAIVGPSSAGKSTLLRLLTGIWTPAAGVVRLDGADLAQWPRDALGPWIGYVPQDVELFPGTVAENIARLGEVDADRVVAAAQRAKVHEMILALPDGYDTHVGVGGGGLSPGQGQRIALARALYGEPRLLLLDEPNSNLDSAGELALAEALRQLKGTVTVVVVTHRTALLQHVDKLLVLDAGRVQQYGSRAEVSAAMQSGHGRGSRVVPIHASTSLGIDPAAVAEIQGSA